MKFGLLYELEMPKPWHERSEYDTYWQAIEQIELAEEVGFEYVWMVEHHFLSEFAHSSAPEVFYGALSQRTKKIRLGHGVVLLPHPFNHPLRVAERIAALDILSNGRVEFGTGRALSRVELEGFGVSPDDSRPMWEEAIRIIPKMWTQETFAHEGKYFTIPPRNVLPKPLQKPHPPIWVAATQPTTFEIAGRMGIGVLSFNVGEPGELEVRRNAYKKAIANAEPVGEFINDQIAAFSVVHCGEDDREAKELGGRAALWYFRKTSEIFLDIWIGSDIEAYKYYGEMQQRMQARWRDRPITEEAVIQDMVERGLVVAGDPHSCIKTIKLFEEQGIDQMICFVQAASIPHEKAMQCIRLMGEQVIPKFSKQGE